MVIPLSPGFQTADGRVYPPGLVRSWRAQLPDGAYFPLAFKVRQTFDSGWRAALTDALTCGVARLHIALLPKWSRGTPDWEWVRATLRELADTIPAASPQVFVRLGNFRDGKSEGEDCDFAFHAHQEAELGALLAEGVPHFGWSVGDDRGLVAAVKGWRERRAIFTERLPVMLEVQSYMESGLSEEHPPLLREALLRHGWFGSLAFVECHRWFKPQDRLSKDFTRLLDAETGEGLRPVVQACAANGIGFLLYTGDTAFEGLDPAQPLNPAGIALFNRPRLPVAPYQPNRLKAWWIGQRLVRA